MAGGFDEFENPAFNKDYEEGNVDDADVDTYLTDLFGENQETQRIAEQQMESMEHLSGETLEDTRKKVIKEKVDNFALVNKKRGGTPAIVNYGNFDIKDEILYVQPFGTSDEIPLEFKKGGITRPFSLSYIARKYGTAFIRETLGFQDFVQKPKSAQYQAAKQTLQELSTVEKNIQPKDVTDTIELQELTNTATKADAAVETMFTDWNLELPDVANKHTQTEGLTLRELQGLDKALQSIRGELTNNLAKLTDIDKDIAKEKRKLQEAEDEISKSDITALLKNLEDERSARLEAATANKEALRGQINRIKETINKVLKEDSTLGERLRTLFKEQGITIVSVLTAIGMIIGVIVEAVIPTSGGAATPSKPPSQGGAKEWVKKQLHNPAKLLANLAGKAAAALPGVIGLIVSWLLTATGKVVNWFGNNLWAVVALVAWLLYAAAKEYISKSRK